jgi:thioredoxin-like negative regulator of GroEL
MNNNFASAQRAYDNMMPEDEEERYRKIQARIAWEEEHADHKRDQEMDEEMDEEKGSHERR